MFISYSLNSNGKNDAKRTIIISQNPSIIQMSNIFTEIYVFENTYFLWNIIVKIISSRNNKHELFYNIVSGAVVFWSFLRFINTSLIH